MAILTWLFTAAALLYGTRFPNHPGKWRVVEFLRGKSQLLGPGMHEVVRSGIKWRLDPSDFAQVDLFWNGSSNLWLLRWLVRGLSPKAVVIDAGANFGYVALSLATLPSEIAIVFALEPSETSFDRLERHIRLNDKEKAVRGIQVALGESSKAAWIHHRIDNSGANRIVDIPTLSPANVVSLDDFTSQHSLSRLDLLILDVEGYEERALVGGALSLKQHHPQLLVKVWEESLQNAGSSAESLLSELRSLGYHKFLRPVRRRMKPIGNFPIESDSYWVHCT